MKKHVFKTISAILALVLMTFALFSCDFSLENNSDSKGYYSVKTLFSYDDVINALKIVGKRQDVKPAYTVDDMGTGYTILYQFCVPHSWTEYPIDYENYFNTKSDGFFTTYIFVESKKCPMHENGAYHASNTLLAYKGDEDYDKIRHYKESYACVRIDNVTEDVVEIEDISLLSYRETELGVERVYDINYGNKTIMKLLSCNDLDDTFFDIFFDNIVIAEVKS